jgi:hypothetical protein
MKKVGLGVDYSNICKNYNTAYLDRDNKDPATAKCMKSVVAWMQGILQESMERFGYGLFKLSTDVLVPLDEVASNRFLFYSLEKEITLQSYVMGSSYYEFNGVTAWVNEATEGFLIQNDEDGEGVYFYCNEGSPEEVWLKEYLQAFSLEEMESPRK